MRTLYIVTIINLSIFTVTNLIVGLLGGTAVYTPEVLVFWSMILIVNLLGQAHFLSKEMKQV